MANGCGNNGNSERLYFGGLQITTDGEFSHEIKRHLLLGRKVMTNIDSMLKSRDIALPKDPSSWTIKKAESQSIDALNCGVGEDP